ncbi:MAG: hypothetical protein ACLFR6_08935 [Salinarchaeum sp.]
MRIGELEAAIRALEAYIGHIERIDEDLEQRANAALAGVEDLESRVQSLESTSSQPAIEQPVTASPPPREPTPVADDNRPAAPTVSANPDESDPDDDGGEPGLLERLRTEL